MIFLGISSKAKSKPKNGKHLKSYTREEQVESNCKTKEQIGDKHLDRNLLTELDLKSIYISCDQKSSCNYMSKTDGIYEEMSSSQSVIDLRTAVTANDRTNNTENRLTMRLNTLTNKKRMKKIIFKLKKSSSFESHKSLVNSTRIEMNSTKLCSNTLIDAIDYKLKLENIDLTEEPYSDAV